jgi:hypothetical protein
MFMRKQKMGHPEDLHLAAGDGVVKPLEHVGMERGRQVRLDQVCR